jgi:hypothetical protein
MPSPSTRIIRPTMTEPTRKQAAPAAPGLPRSAPPSSRPARRRCRSVAARRRRRVLAGRPRQRRGPQHAAAPARRPGRGTDAGAFNVRTRVHEYGGGAYAGRGRHGVFSNFADNRLYRHRRRRRGTRCRSARRRAALRRLRAGPRTPAPGRACAKTMAGEAISRSTRCARSAPTAAKRCWPTATTSIPRRACRRTAASSPG